MRISTVSWGTTKMDGIFSRGSINDEDDVGLMSCTESLGFESSDERRVLVGDRIIHESLTRIDEEQLCLRRKASSFNKIKKEVAIHKKFPPPLSSLSQDGRPTFYLRPVRGDGRLMLTEVKIVRPEILRASRQDGRLRLHLVQDIPEEDEIDDYEDEEEVVEIQNINEEYIREENLKNEELEGWQFSGSNTAGGGGDGVRRCYEQVSHHQHVWRQHCLTIR